MKDLTTGKPIKIILLFAIPLFIGQLFQLFYSLADTRIVGAILGETSLAAVGATTTLSDFLIGLLNGFTNGCAIIIATYFGSGDRDNMKKAIGGTILSGIVLSVLISAGCLLFLPRILGALNVADFLMAESKAYIGIVLAGLLAATLYNVCAAILRALGDTFTPLLFLILAAVLNVVLDYTLIKYGNMGVAGAALATVIAQASSAVLRPPSAALPQSQFLPLPPLGESCCYRAYIPASLGFCHSIQNTLSPAAVHSRPHYRDKSCPVCPLCPSQKAPASHP